MGKSRRTGGRSARVRSAVLGATQEELAERGVAGLSIAAIAARAGVHPTSIYRRWKTPETLALDAALAAAEANAPIPDTGSLRADLAAFLTMLDAHVRSPLGQTLLALSGLDTPESRDVRELFWKQRFAAAGAIFERAIARGELDRKTNAEAALELAIAPIYLRALILRRPGGAAAIARHVDTTLAALGAAQA